MPMTARFASPCPDCGAQIAEGAQIKKGARGKYVHATCPVATAPTARMPKRITKIGASRAPKTPPPGPELRNDSDSYTIGDVRVVQLTAAEIAECEARQADAGVTATDIPGDKPIKRAGDRRVAVVVVHTDRMRQEDADDNGYCGRYGAVVRLATAEEAAPILADRAAKSAALTDAKAKEQAWQAERALLTAGRCYVETVELSERQGAVVIHEERKGLHGSISARWSRLVDGSVMHESFAYDDHRCGRYVTVEQLLELARGSTRTLEDAIRGQRYSALDRAIVWLAAQAGKAPRPPVTVTLRGLEQPVTLVVRLSIASGLVMADVLGGGTVSVPMAGGGVHVQYGWSWNIDALRGQLDAPPVEVFTGIEFAPGAEIGGDRIVLPDGLWVEGMRAALAELAVRS